MRNPYYTAHIAAYYSFKAKNDKTTFGKFNMMDKASRYLLACSVKWKARGVDGRSSI